MMQAQTTHSPRMKVISTIRRWIDKGELNCGDRIPAELSLAQQLEVSRDTVRAALQDMEDQGLLTSSRNRTRQVANVPAKPRSGASLMSRSIAIIANFGDPDRNFDASTMGAVQQEAMQEITSSGWHAIRLEPKQAAEESFIDQLLYDPPAGLLMTENSLSNPQVQQLVARLRQAEIPVVVNDDEPEIHDCDHVIFNHYAGSHMVTDYLIQHGCKHIKPIYFCDRHLAWASRRQAGYEAAMREAGLKPMEVQWVDPRWDRTNGEFDEERFEMLTRLFVGYLAPLLNSDRKPDAVMVINDGHVYPIASACRVLGLEPNKDILLGGYDNSWSISYERFVEPHNPIVTIDKNNPKAGREMVRLLIDRLEGRIEPVPQIRSIEPLLIEPQKASTAFKSMQSKENPA